jgi:hypothetical protein
MTGGRSAARLALTVKKPKRNMAGASFEVVIWSLIIVNFRTEEKL